MTTYALRPLLLQGLLVFVCVYLEGDGRMRKERKKERKKAESETTRRKMKEDASRGEREVQMQSYTEIFQEAPRIFRKLVASAVWHQLSEDFEDGQAEEGDAGVVCADTALE